MRFSSVSAAAGKPAVWVVEDAALFVALDFVAVNVPFQRRH